MSSGTSLRTERRHASPTTAKRKQTRLKYTLFGHPTSTHKLIHQGRRGIHFVHIPGSLQLLHFLQDFARHHEAYILLISCWYRSCTAFLFSLNAAVTNPMSGDHCSAHNFTAPGISNLWSLPEGRRKKDEKGLELSIAGYEHRDKILTLFGLFNQLLQYCFLDLWIIAQFFHILSRYSQTLSNFLEIILVGYH